VSLVYFEEVEDRKSAMKREIQIKNMTHERKRKLAEGFSKNTGM
jgi:predicted GIY-YIG superfamily endonuclease